MTQWGLDTLFNPAKRHMDEEKRRLQSTREEVGDASGGNRIDFESGKVTIRRSSKTKAELDEPGDVAETSESAAPTETAEVAEADASQQADATQEADAAAQEAGPDAPGAETD